MDKHTRCIYYFLKKMFSHRLKRKPDVSNLLTLKLAYAMSIYQKFWDCKTAGPFYALVWFSQARGPHTLIGRGKSPFHSRSRCFISAWVLDLRKNTGWFSGEKVPFLWSTIYPANFDTFNGHLELVPSRRWSEPQRRGREKGFKKTYSRIVIHPSQKSRFKSYREFV